MSKVWLVTGSASGLGRDIAEAVLAAGDRLVATARDPRRLNDLVKKIPIPAFGRTKATLPRASRLSLLWEIFILTFVPGGKGFSVATWHPKRLRSLVCSLV